MLDLETLLYPLDNDAPCGEDLEYDDEFIALEMANKPGEERVIGDSVIPAESQDFTEVAKIAESLLSRTKDLRVAVILGHATLETEGLAAFEQVLAYIRGCLEQFWDTAHPQLDEDDGDPTMRVNAIVGLTNRTTVLHALRNVPLTNSRAFGPFSLRDMEVASGEVTPPIDMENVPAEQTIAAGFQDEDQDQVAATVAAAQSILEHIKEIDAIFDREIGADGPDLDPIKKVAFDINKRLSRYAGTSEADEPEENAPATDGAAPAPRATGGTAAINTPHDVTNALDRIMDYYARQEPSSPLPILLNRAKRLVSADFVTIMRDLAPQGVENVALIGGFEEHEEEETEDEDY